MSAVTRVWRAVELRQPNGKPASMLSNTDLLPVPPEHRLWTAINYWSFWLADSFNVKKARFSRFTFMIASTGVGLGLTWWQCWLGWIGGQAVYCLLLAIWPSLANLHNGIPSSGTDTAHFLCFFLFMLILAVAVWFPMHTIRHLFTVKAAVAPAAGIALFTWCLVKAGGAGDLLHAPATIKGEQFGWEFCGQLMACISNMATLITNAIDFSSRASKPSDVVIPQIVSLPLCFAITSLFGILIASATPTIFGEFVWSPLEVMERFLKVEGGASHGTRAGVAFIAIGFIIAQLGTNISANTLSAGCDLTAILPRVLNIRRGGYLACIVGFCMCPWHLLSDSANFSTYLSAYSVLLSSIVGVMVCHYFVVVKQRVKVADLYSVAPESLYRYWGGFNLRAYIAYICGIAINIVGFAGAVGRDVPLAAQRIYTLSFFTGFGVAFVIYYLACLIYPLRIPTDEELEEVPAALVNAGVKPHEASLYGTEAEGEKAEYKEEPHLAKGGVELV
ncbi:hypothetical protein Rhopal_006611-T1 [Rhodotorula paludigena]|uniref:Uracil permease n=1 Tax=Rhodotorula paludigena TaxID=86838 RepID=A0AAV5GUE6_9BASI|nr:hypothetical protein Rhopal_006611-T1 [Rhodotorula paludigena]